MIEVVNNKMFEQFISNFRNMMVQENGDGDNTGRPKGVKPFKLAPLVGSVIVSELKKN